MPSKMCLFLNLRMHFRVDSLYDLIRTYPSGTGTFFWALGATGLNSPEKKAATSAPNLSPLDCCFVITLMSCKLEQARSWTSKSAESISNGSFSRSNAPT